MRRTTLILGAGSSHFLGYPVGSRLRQDILELAYPTQLDFAIQCGLMETEGLLYRFIDAFRRSQLYSIDSFLGRRPEFAEIGKKAIAAVLLRVEVAHQLSHIEGEDHWYRHLLNRLCSKPLTGFERGVLSIVTFNYDRSLEAFLFEAIQAVFDVDQSTAANALQDIPIVHVYGWLGSPVPGETDYLPYGGSITSNAVTQAARGIIVIPEGRADSDTLASARQYISQADQIAFLGFGFDEVNMARLQTDQTCQDMQQRPGGWLTREVNATCLGLTHAEALRAHSKLAQKVHTQRRADGWPSGFWHCGCLQLLRETEMLAEP